MRSRKFQETIQTYLVSVGSIYLFAFASLYLQVPGLYGKNGLLPVKNIVHQIEGNLSIVGHVEALRSFPSFLIYSDKLGIPLEYTMELMCFIGVLLSIGVIMFTAMRTSVVFLVLWALYLSLVKVGQTFLHFQWDTLLLETGLITVMVAPLNVLFSKRPSPKPHDVSSLWLVRWLLFRLMFASGVVKLTSQCPTWWGLTALNWHFESQCIPTPLSWYVHQLPEWLLKLQVVGTYYVEILVPFLFFVPVRSLRLFSFWCQVFFQVCIILTGNYNFFNLLTMVLCVSLLDDDCYLTKRRKKVTLDWIRKLTNWIFGKHCGRIIHILVRLTLFMGGVIGLGVVCWHYFGLKIEGRQILFKTAFSSDDLSLALSYAVPVTACIGGISLVIELLYAVWDSLDMTGLFNKVWSLLQTIIMGAAIIGLFSLSLISHGVLHKPFISNLPEHLTDIYRVSYPFQITNSYGLFRSMTGVGGRPELIIEGSNNETDPWKEYNFFYKPGDVNTSPLYILPHQPRLDWQMWFAALGSHQHNPWLVNLIYKLLQGQKEVMELMGPPPFDKPPRLIRITRYTYHYTSYNYKESLFDQSGSWWTRKYESEYIFALSVDHKGLLDFIVENNFTSDSELNYCNNRLCLFLDHIRQYTRLVLPHEFLWMLIATISIISITMKYILKLFNSIRKEKKKDYHTNNSTMGNSTIDNTIDSTTNTGKAKKKSNTKKRNPNKTNDKQ